MQYVSMRYSAWLADAGVDPSVENASEAYDNELADRVIGLSKAEVSTALARGGASMTRSSPRTDGSVGSAGSCRWRRSGMFPQWVARL